MAEGLGVRVLGVALVFWVLGLCLGFGFRVFGFGLGFGDQRFGIWRRVWG